MKRWIVTEETSGGGASWKGVFLFLAVVVVLWAAFGK